MNQIVAPTSGVINKIKNNKVQIYIAPEDDHHVFSPVSGIISKITIENGHWIRHIETDEFVADFKKDGRVTVQIQTNFGKLVSFWLEVGEGYITDRIKLSVTEGSRVNKGDLIGEIILGSLSEVQLPNNNLIRASLIQKVVGGQTIISTLM